MRSSSVTTTSVRRNGPAVEVRRLSKTYRGGVEAVKGIDFEVAAGEVFGLIGPNGAGKWTTIGMLTTTIAPTGGTARLVGYDVAAEPIAARRVSAVVFQDAVIDRALTGRRNLEIHARLWNVEPATAETRIDEVVAAFGSAEIIDRPVDGYSGGQHRRLEIGRADLRTAGAVPGRADRRPRPANPLRIARPHRRSAGLHGDDDPAHDPLPRRSRASLRSRGDRSRGADRRARFASCSRS